MDYKDLLKKYMKIILSCEGDSYIGKAKSHGIDLTQEEEDALVDIDHSIE